VCKYFLDAVEKKQYGWFWVCPNGGKDCHYRHALPPGYLQVKSEQGMEESSFMPSADMNSEILDDDDDDDDELDIDELNELEASLSRTSIQIREPGIESQS
ncbi:hypothetical protein B296_00041980, partial [Ensete ventricosum]